MFDIHVGGKLCASIFFSAPVNYQKLFIFSEQQEIHLMNIKKHAFTL